MLGAAGKGNRMYIWLSVAVFGAALALVGLGLLARDWRRGQVQGAEMAVAVTAVLVFGCLGILELYRGVDLYGLSELGVWGVIAVALVIAERRRRRLARRRDQC